MPSYQERAPGNYPAEFKQLDTEYPITVRETGEEAIRWRWVFQCIDPKDDDPVIDTITTPGFKARSNGLKLFTGMLGRAPRPGDDTDALIGQVFDVQYGPNQNGRNTVVGALKRTPTAPQNVTDLTASQDAKAHATGATKAAEQHAAQEGEAVPDELPF